MNYSAPTRCTLQNSTKHAFTLVELLAVIVIVAILIALGGIAVQGSLQSQNLRSTGRQLAADLDFAILLARKENRPVDVIFYKYSPAELGGPEAIRAYQFGILTGFNTDNTPKYRFLVEAKRFPGGIVASTDKEYNTLLNLSERNALAQSGSGVTENYKIHSYQIRPDGTTTLARDKPQSLTLIFEKDLGLGSKLPPDFRTVAIDPATARARLY